MSPAVLFQFIVLKDNIEYFIVLHSVKDSIYSSGHFI